jgi:hypothetical protein
VIKNTTRLPSPCSGQKADTFCPHPNRSRALIGRRATPIGAKQLFEETHGAPFQLGGLLADRIRLCSRVKCDKLLRVHASAMMCELY